MHNARFFRTEFFPCAELDAERFGADFFSVERAGWDREREDACVRKGDRPRGGFDGGAVAAACGGGDECGTAAVMATSGGVLFVTGSVGSLGVRRSAVRGTIVRRTAIAGVAAAARGAALPSVEFAIDGFALGVDRS